MAAVDSSKFFDMIVGEVVFTRVPDLVWKLQANFVFHLKRFFRQGNRLENCGKR